MVTDRPDVVFVGKVELSLDPDRVYQAQGIRRGAVSPAVRRATEALLPEARRLLEPALCYRLLAVEHVERKRVAFAEGFSFGGRLPARLFSPASHVFAAVGTAGRAIDARIAALAEAGDVVEAFILDAAAIAAVGELKSLIQSLARGWAADRGLMAGTPIGPANDSWPLADQTVFAAMFALDQIGVELTESLMFRPTKTASLAIAIGKQVADGDTCDYCAIQSRCDFRAGADASGVCPSGAQR